MALFERSPEVARATPVRRQDAEPGQRSSEMLTVIGPGVQLEGKLKVDGDARIDGLFSGEVVVGGTLTIGEAARVDAELSVGTLILRGHLRGKTVAQLTHLQAPG